MAEGPSKADMDKIWERTQRKTFTAWVNSKLKVLGTSITNIEMDFDDGIKLAQLLNVISGGKVPQINLKPTMRIHKIQNTGACTKYIAENGVKLVGVAPEEIVDHNQKMILGMVWTIILRWSIQDISLEEMSAKEGLLLWCQRKTEGYPHVKVTNFHTSFQDGLALCALIHRHRPDLLDFHKLDPADKAGNLQLAFDIAANHLDIPPMLDVGDMLDVPKPDERSVMTYVAAFFHVFSASQKAETAAKRVAKVLEFAEQTGAAKADYTMKATNLGDWINKTIVRMDDRNFGDSVESIQGHVDNFKAYKNNEKPPKASELAALEAAYNAIQAKLRLNSRASFVPPAGLSPPELDALWLRLEKAEQERAEALRNALRRQRKLDYNIQKFNNKLNRLGEWIINEDSYLKNADVGQSLSIILAQIKNLEAFNEEYASVGATFDSDTNDILQKLEALGYPHIAQLRDRKHTLIAGPWEALKQAAVQRKTTLEETLAKIQAIESLLLDFAKRSAQLNIWVDSNDDFLTDPIIVESADAVNELQQQFDRFVGSIGEKTAEYNSLGALAEQIKSNGVSEKVYSKLSYADLTAKWNSFQAQIQTRREKLVAEAQTQQQNEALRVEFASKAKSLNEYISEETAKVSSVTSSGAPLDEQSQIANANAARIKSNQRRYEEVQEVNQRVEDALITDNKHTEFTIEALKFRWDKLNHLAVDTADIISKQILSAQNADVSAEELAEFHECFTHFDRDSNGSLAKLELDACMKSLGEDLKEDQLQAIIQNYGNENGVVTFDNFVKYLTTSRKGSDSVENIRDSFRIMAGDKAFITEPELRSVLPPNRVDYLIQNMPKYQGAPDKYDYIAFSNTLYAQ